MAYKISPDLCVACGTCIDECPVEAISYKYGFAEKSKKKKETN